MLEAAELTSLVGCLCTTETLDPTTDLAKQVLKILFFPVSDKGFAELGHEVSITRPPDSKC
jgi:hypothetical protein